MNGFLTRLIQRSRGDADTAMPYRAPKWAYGVTRQIDTPMPATTEAVTTTDTPWFAEPDASVRPGFPENDELAQRTLPAKLRPGTTIESRNAQNTETQTVNSSNLRQSSETTNAITLFPPIQPLSSDEPCRSSPSTSGTQHAVTTETVTPATVDTQNSLQPTTPHTVINSVAQLTPTANTRHSANRHRLMPPQPNARSQARPLEKPAMQLSQENQTIDVHVHIGRIDICATPKNMPSKQKPSAKSQPTMTLNDYIQQRTGAKR